VVSCLLCATRSLETGPLGTGDERQRPSDRNSKTTSILRLLTAADELHVDRLVEVVALAFLALRVPLVQAQGPAIVILGGWCALPAAER
jgi:hypothetical protein